MTFNTKNAVDNGSCWANVKFDNTYSMLPSIFYTQVLPVPVASPCSIKVNTKLAQELGLDIEQLESKNNLNIFSGNRLPQHSSPIAMAYAGHQFGQFVDQLGDGRANLIGQVISRRGERYDIQLKGAGKTPYSRHGDGRAPMGAVICEYIVSEAMHALGISSTRSLAAVATGEMVERQGKLPGAILTRVAKSHIRVGTFEYFKCRNDNDSIKQLADHVITNYYPEVSQSECPYFDLLKAIIDKQAQLIASWQHVGFIHGVMNTDNTSITGETLDYGPCAFMDDFSNAKVFSAIDQQGRYSYGNQAYMGLWNLIRLAETFLPLLDEEQAQASEKAKQALATFEVKFHAYWLNGMRQKLGLKIKHAEDESLIKGLFELMEGRSLDFTLTFSSLTKALSMNNPLMFLDYLGKGAVAGGWFVRWQERLSLENESLEELSKYAQKINPIYIPRNHMIEKVIRLAIDNNDFSMMHEMVDVLSNPYHEKEQYNQYALAPTKEECVRETFCGT